MGSAPSLGPVSLDSSARKRAFLYAVMSGIAWIAFGAESILRPWQVNARDAVWAIPFSLTALSFVYIHRMQRGRAPLLESVGFYAVMLASLLAFVGNAGVLLNQRTMAIFGFPYGALLWTVGLVLFGVGTWRALVLPRYGALTLILLEPCSLLTGLALSPIAPLLDRGAYSGGVEKGLAMLIIALAIQKAGPEDRH